MKCSASFALPPLHPQQHDSRQRSTRASSSCWKGIGDLPTHRPKARCHPTRRRSPEDLMWVTFLPTRADVACSQKCPERHPTHFPRDGPMLSDAWDFHIAPSCLPHPLPRRRPQLICQPHLPPPNFPATSCPLDLCLWDSLC